VKSQIKAHDNDGGLGISLRLIKEKIAKSIGHELSDR